MSVWLKISRPLRLAAIILIGCVASFSIASAASAQDANASSVSGSLQLRVDGEPQPIPGVTLTVTDADGAEIGMATSAEDGTWSVEVPGPGVYTVTLDESTLPEGVSLRGTLGNTRVAELTAVGDQAVLFALGDGSGSAVTTPDSTDSNSSQTPDGRTVIAVQLFVDGLKFGLIIAMCAVGLSLIYGTTGLVNFAHGEMVTLGAMTAFFINVKSGLGGIFGSLIFGAVLAVLVTGIAGGLFNEFVWKPLRGRGASLIAALVVSIGFSIMMRYTYLLFFGGRAKFYTDYQLQDKHYFFGLFGLATKEIVVMGLSVAVLVLVALGLERTKAGKAMRAVADNRDLAESSGIDVETVVRWVWVVGSALAGLGGVFFALTENINWEMGFRILLLMFAGITLGGLGTAYGALFGSLIIGVFIQMSTLGFGPVPGVPPDLKNVGALLIMVLILLFRPQGLLGRSERVG